jgi:capsular polysaccharide transport system ATP-binding protein
MAGTREKITSYVADFSELGAHFYQPIKGYSSGMRARLAFGLSLAFDFDYYLIDEVIAVGDDRFREKCRDALSDIQSRAGVILVSHSRAMIKRYCDKVAVVHDRNVQFFDDRKTGYRFYKSLVKAARMKAGAILDDGTTDEADEEENAAAA